MSTSEISAKSLGAFDFAIADQASRDQLVAQSLGWRALLVILMIDLFIASIAVALASYAGAKPDALFAEGSFITLVSSLHLVGVCGLCLLIFQQRSEREGSWRDSHLIWLFAAGGAALLAFDDAAGLHEWLDLQLHGWLGLAQSPLTDRIDDLIVLGYGVIAAIAIIICRREASLAAGVKRLFVIAGVLFLVMVAADLLTNSYGSDPAALSRRARLALLASWANVLEDTIKLCSEGAMLAALVATVWLLKEEQRV